MAVRVYMLATALVASSVLVSTMAAAGNNGERDSKVFVWPSTKRVKVSLVNEFRVDMFVNCWSEDDMMSRTLRRGEVFSFLFHPNIWGNTVYVCQVSTDKGHPTLYRHFSPYTTKRDHARCPPGSDTCCWKFSEYKVCSCKDDRVCLSFSQDIYSRRPDNAPLNKMT